MLVLISTSSDRFHLKLFTWGCGNAGRLGHGNVLDVWRPRVVDRLYRIRMKAMMASGSYDHSAVCCENGTVWTWGLGEHGQLGVGSTGESEADVDG